MFGRIRRFVSRHYPKVIYGMMAFPILYKVTNYVGWYYLHYRKQKNNELVEKCKKQQMFEMMEENFGRTLRNWLDLMKESIKEHLNADKLAEQLRDGSGDKMENWMRLKIVGFASTMSYVYGSAMLSVLLRIQVNVISGLLFKQLQQTPDNLDFLGIDPSRPKPKPELYHFKEEIEDKPPPGPGKNWISEEIQQDYMILTRYLCTEGVVNLCKVMHERCRRVIGKISLKQKMTVADVEELFRTVRLIKIEDEDVVKDYCPVNEAWRYVFSEAMKLQFLFPVGAFNRKPCMTKHEDFLRTLIGEAYDLISATDTKTILRFLESQGINYHLDRISDFIHSIPVSSDSESTSSADAGYQSENGLEAEPSVVVAKLIPVMNAFLNVPYSEDVWASLLLHNETLKAFSANVYESYSDTDKVLA